jgi:hypothetical protein
MYNNNLAVLDAGLGLYFPLLIELLQKNLFVSTGTLNY